MSLDNGGHCYGSPVNQSGLLYNSLPYGVDEAVPMTAITLHCPLQEMIIADCVRVPARHRL